MSRGKPAKRYTVAEAAEYAGISRSRLYRQIDAGKLKATRHGDSWVIMESDLDKWLAMPRPRGWPAGRSRKPAEVA